MKTSPDLVDPLGLEKKGVALAFSDVQLWRGWLGLQSLLLVLPSVKKIADVIGGNSSDSTP